MREQLGVQGHLGLSSGDDNGGGVSCAVPHGASHPEIRSLERVSPT